MTELVVKLKEKKNVSKEAAACLTILRIVQMLVKQAY